LTGSFANQLTRRSVRPAIKDTCHFRENYGFQDDKNLRQKAKAARIFRAASSFSAGAI
jgi:hypothetical protein